MSEEISYQEAVDYSDFNPWAMSSFELAAFIESIPARHKAVENHWDAVKKEHWDLLQKETALRTRMELLDIALQEVGDRACEFIKQWGFDYKDRQVLNAFIAETDSEKERLTREWAEVRAKRRDLSRRAGVEFVS